MKRALLCFALVACTDEVDPDAPVDCAKVTDDDTFVVGLEKVGRDSVLTFRLMSATPAPPARYENTWTVEIDSSGGPLANADITATPYMPVHDHVSAIRSVSTALPDAGQYEIERVNFSMPGVWETTIRATAGATTDSAMFRFCIP